MPTPLPGARSLWLLQKEDRVTKQPLKSPRQNSLGKALTDCLILEPQNGALQVGTGGAVVGDIHGQRGHRCLRIAFLTLNLDELLQESHGLVAGICER